MPGPDEQKPDAAAPDAPADKVNGHGSVEPSPQAPQPGLPQGTPAGMKQARDFLDARVEPVLTVVFQGILHSCPGIPPHEILNSICRVTGARAASAVQADLKTLFELRKGFNEAFAEGVRSAPLTQPQSPGIRPHA